MGTREFTDTAERTRRRDLVRSIGDAVFGKRLGRDSEDGTPKLAWHTDLANTIEAATGRALGRSRVAQWLLTTDDAKPVPSWVMEALPAIARAAAADLRARAAQLDALAAEDGAPPAPQGEPEADGEGPQESGSAAAEASVSEHGFSIDPGSLARDEGEFDVGAFVDNFVETYAHVRPPR